MSRNKATTRRQETLTVVADNPFEVRGISAMTPSQACVFEHYRNGKNILMTGSAGTGKTFIALALALEEVERGNSFSKVVIVRSVVPTRDIGALPGDINEKSSIYEQPYEAICQELYTHTKAYSKLKALERMAFISTSFIRGRTLNDAIVIVDECQNMTHHELDSIITRLGNRTRIIFCGDFKQSDLTKESERVGFLKFEKTLRRMKSVAQVVFTPQDIVRSGLVKEYLLAAED